VPNKGEIPLSDEYFTLWVMIAQTKDVILKARQRDYARFGISNERRAVLWSIQNGGGHATPVNIARQLFRELHSVTEMLVRMEKEGLVTRYKGSGRSRIEVKLTPKGQDIFNQSLHNETDKRIFSTLTKKQREQLMSCLWKVRKQALIELGIPEWHIKFPLDPNSEDK
jgi:MarR family transcriptional regulator, organic hydroperoxide resistance regulator